MSKDTNTYTPKTVVHITTGKVIEMLTTQPQPSNWEPTPRPVGWGLNELKSNGLPDRRTNPRAIGVRRRDYGDGEIDVSGNYSEFRGAVVEGVAAVLREKVRLAKLALEASEDALLNYYDVLDNGPRL